MGRPQTYCYKHPALREITQVHLIGYVLCVISAGVALPTFLRHVERVPRIAYSGFGFAIFFNRSSNRSFMVVALDIR